MPQELIDFCQGLGEDSMILDNNIFYHNIVSMGKTNGFKISRKKLKNHIGKYKITRLTKS